MSQTRDASIDFTRVIASILVVMIHTTNWLISTTVGRYAVPFFMVVSGYFYFLNPSHDRMMKIINNLMRLWIIWMVIYIPMGIHVLIGLNFKKIIFKLIWSIIGSSIFYGGSWYLPAAAFGLWVVDYLNRKGFPIVRNVLAFISLFIGCISSNYSGIHLGILSSIHWCNSIVIGVVWMTLAYYIAKYNQIIKKRFHSVWWLVLAVGLTVFERMIVLKFNLSPDLSRNDIYWTLPLSIWIIFGFILGHSWEIEKDHSLLFRDFATLLFFTQFAFLSLNISNHLINFITVLTVSSVVSLMILGLSKFKHLKWIKYLYE